jgi:hypothetical protein
MTYVLQIGDGRALGQLLAPSVVPSASEHFRPSIFYARTKLHGMLQVRQVLVAVPVTRQHCTSAQWFVAV